MQKVFKENGKILEDFPDIKKLNDRRSTRKEQEQ